MSDYEGFEERPVLAPPGIPAKKVRPRKERKDNLHAGHSGGIPSGGIPSGYVPAVINGMEVLVKRPSEEKVRGVIEPREPLPAKKPRAKTAWSEFVRLNGMVSKKNPAAYAQFMEQYKQFKESYVRRP